jgi:hypothetical protein
MSGVMLFIIFIALKSAYGREGERTETEMIAAHVSKRPL